MEEGVTGVEDTLAFVFCVILCTTVLLLPIGLALLWYIRRGDSYIYQIEYTHNKKLIVTPFLDNVTYNMVVKELKKKLIIYLVTKRKSDDANQCNCSENTQEQTY